IPHNPNDALPRIVISAADHDRLAALVDNAPQQDSPVIEYLARELDRAEIVSGDADADVARAGSEVVYRDERDGRERTITLAWPHEAGIEHARVSVLAAIGAALLGLRPGQSIDWPSPA